jgi:hypothetical protein
VTAWKTPTFTCRQGKSDGLEDECVHHQHLETPSVWDDEPVALRGEDGSDTGWECRGEYRYSNLQVGWAPLKPGHHWPSAQPQPVPHGPASSLESGQMGQHTVFRPSLNPWSRQQLLELPLNLHRGSGNTD